MSSYLGHKIQTLSINATNEEIYNCLSELTDDDYNGSNDGDCYTEIETPYGIIYCSELAARMFEYENESKEKTMLEEHLTDFIYNVIGDNYNGCSNYADFNVDIKTVNQELVISVAILSED